LKINVLQLSAEGYLTYSNLINNLKHKLMEIVTLTQEQWKSLSEVNLSNLSETMRYRNKTNYEWWKDNILGYTPYRIDRISDLTFEVYRNPL